MLLCVFSLLLLLLLLLFFFISLFFSEQYSGRIINSSISLVLVNGIVGQWASRHELCIRSIILCGRFIETLIRPLSLGRLVSAWFIIVLLLSALLEAFRQEMLMNLEFPASEIEIFQNVFANFRKFFFFAAKRVREIFEGIPVVGSARHKDPIEMVSSCRWRPGSCVRIGNGPNPKS